MAAWSWVPCPGGRNLPPYYKAGREPKTLRAIGADGAHSAIYLPPGVLKRV